jgi:Anaphase-promoting complex APC subunit CDC26
MLRRPATLLHLNQDDLAIFEKQYAQGQIYPHHHPQHHQTQQQYQNDSGEYWGSEREEDEDMATPQSERDEIMREAIARGEARSMDPREMAGGAPGVRRSGEERRPKTREERIRGTNAGSSSNTGAGSGSGSGSGATGTGVTQQQR